MEYIVEKPNNTNEMDIDQNTKLVNSVNNMKRKLQNIN